MIKSSEFTHVLQSSLELPCGAILKNRLAKSPMSDSLGDGVGDPTEAQIRLYERWAEGGVALSFIGEVQGDPRFPEKPGNLVLGALSNQKMLKLFTRRALIEGAHLWPQIGHAGALSHLPISQPKGPSALDIMGLQCSGMSLDEIRELPDMYARTALHAKTVGFSGVHLHAGHGFLLSQFLSPLFNHRKDGYGGSIEARSRIVLEVISAVRRAVGPSFPVGIRINSTDQLEGGLTEVDALELVRILDQTSIDLIDISGGTYFPGAKASSDGTSRGPYFLDFARLARGVTNIPLMLTGGFKKREQAVDAVASGAVDMVGIGRAMALNTRLANAWLSEEGGDPDFPKFETPPPGGITAWYTMRMTALGEDREEMFKLDLPTAIHLYEKRDAQRSIKWQEKFAHLQK
ncbi:MAG: NADH:flavin oxidoreductase/NADH oxidase family protein [Bacteroidales bacterium]|jgi:2,4-dienoyl-CoA reductase-like NADH-dependent reductase (Old Yellow Enzyme family)|nr:NADH:flavin oxidoreductase/NADH oxidase family protein [Bacteroidales bacterium]